MKHTEMRASLQLVRLALLFCLLLAAVSAQAADEPGYGFYRTVEGDVRLTTLDRAEPLDVEPNYPLLRGDRVWIAAGSRLEAVLPDQNVLRVGGGTDLYFEDLALYADESASMGTVLRLLEGEVQIVVNDFGRGAEPLRVDTPNATIYLQQAGTYRVYADERRWTELVVREGFGEVSLEQGSIVVRANEEAVIDGESDPRVRVYPAGAIDDLEAWAAELDHEAVPVAAEPYVDEQLAYQAAPLRRHGEWLPVDRGYAWRPRVPLGWRPYSHGRWTYTPAGLYWVSGYPWGALTFHYGSWSLHATYGWVWYPGRVFSPAWVYWYWGPSYVGWVPSGYYTHYYGPRYYHGPHYAHGGFHFGFHFGTCGYSAGSWSHYAHWTFSPVRYFGWRSYHTHWRSGAELHRYHRGTAVPRGVIARDTRGLDRRVWSRPAEAREVLLRKRANRGVLQGDVPDVTGFVARRNSLSSEVKKAVFVQPGEARSGGSSPATRRQTGSKGFVADVQGRESSAASSPRGSARGSAPGSARDSENSRISKAAERYGGGAATRSPSAVRTLPPSPDRIRTDLVRKPASRAGDVSRIDSGSPSRRTLPRATVGQERDEPRSPSSSTSGAGAGDRRVTSEPPRVGSREPRSATALPPSARRFASGSRQSSGDSTQQRLPTPPSRRLGESARPSLPERSRLGTPSGPAPTLGASSRRETPVVQRVLDSIRGNRQSAPSRPLASGLSSPSGGSNLRRFTPPSVTRPSVPSASRQSAPRVSPSPRAWAPSASSRPQVTRPNPSISSGRSSSSSSSSKSGRPASSSRSQSRSKTKPPG